MHIGDEALPREGDPECPIQSSELGPRAHLGVASQLLSEIQLDDGLLTARA